MEVERLVDELSRPGALPGAPERVEVVHTHASVVFLAPERVYKVKKPLDLGFLDYSTLARRKHFCEEEVRLNRRTAPSVYLGVLPITEGPDGLRIGGEGEAVEWAVHMRRLPEGRTLRDLVHRGALTDALVDEVGAVIAAFHAEARRGPHHFAELSRVADNARDNVRALRERGVHPPLVDRLERATEAAIAAHGPRIAARAEHCVAIHGDLRLEHVYALETGLVIIDGIEFSEALRFADPTADLGFLSMDLRAYGDWPRAARLESAWVHASGEAEAAPLLPFYVAYRSAVRAKVAAIAAADAEIPAPARAEARARTLRHLLLALAVLEARGPRLVLVGGLPGTGKTTVARRIAARIGGELVRSDVIRKELAGLHPTADAAAPPEQGLYAPAHSERTYATVLARARELLAAGRAAVLDATWSTEARRAEARALAVELGLPFDLVVCELDEDTVAARLAARTGDASDADIAIHRHAKARWQAPAGAIALDTSGELEAVHARVDARFG